MKCIFKLGFNIYNLFNRGSRNQSFSSFVLSIITISLLVLVPLYLFIKPVFFSIQLISIYSVVNSSYQFFETIIMIGTLFIMYCASKSCIWFGYYKRHSTLGVIK
jgi:hypothetical protein